MYSVMVAGSTSRTAQCAQALLDDGRFNVTLILTPTPKLIGRKKDLIKNTLHQWAEKNQIQTILVTNKIDESIKNQVDISFDFLLVVDFGYFVPNWMLALPKIAPLNIHPSALPKWRGSSPGQFVLLNGEQESAVTLMIPNSKLDQGPIVFQNFFPVNPNWNQTQYYQFSFDLICQSFPQKMIDLAEKKIQPQPQPELSPTPVAKRLTKEDSFVEWKKIEQAMTAQLDMTEIINLERASRAYHPWPMLWTIIPTNKGDKRMKIIQTHVNKNSLVLDQVQIEGLAQATSWNEIKNLIN